MVNPEQCVQTINFLQKCELNGWGLNCTDISNLLNGNFDDILVSKTTTDKDLPRCRTPKYADRELIKTHIMFPKNNVLSESEKALFSHDFDKYLNEKIDKDPDIWKDVQIIAANPLSINKARDAEYVLVPIINQDNEKCDDVKVFGWRWNMSKSSDGQMDTLVLFQDDQDNKALFEYDFHKTINRLCKKDPNYFEDSTEIIGTLGEKIMTSNSMSYVRLSTVNQDGKKYGSVIVWRWEVA